MQCFLRALRVLRAFVVNLLMFAAAGCHPEEGKVAVVTLRLWAFGREGEEVQQLIPEFERRHPGIRVRVQQIPWIAAHEKLLTAYVGDATPDLAQIGNTWIPEFAALGALEPLDRWVSRSAVVDSAAYFGGVWSTNTIGDTLFGLPWYVDTRVIFYRTDILARAGYREMPATWAEWRRAMRGDQARHGPGPLSDLPAHQRVGSALRLRHAGGLHAARQRGALRGLLRFRLSPGVRVLRGAVPRAAWRRRLATWRSPTSTRSSPGGGSRCGSPGPGTSGEFRQADPGRSPGRLGHRAAAGAGGRLGRGVDRRRIQPGDVPRLAAQGGCLEAGGVSLRAGATGEVSTVSPATCRRESMPGRPPDWPMTPRPARSGVQLHRVQPVPKVPEVELIATRVFESAEQVIRGGRPAGAALEALDRDVDRILEKRRWMLDRRRGAVTARPPSSADQGRAALGVPRAGADPDRLLLLPARRRLTAAQLHRLRHLRHRAIRPTSASSASATTPSWWAARCSGSRFENTLYFVARRRTADRRRCRSARRCW